MDRFNLAREDKRKLWVQTPFPVTSNVWGFFIKDIFPKFYIEQDKLSVVNNDLRKAMERWEFKQHKYLVRERNDDGSYKSCIADGEIFGWTHADLPDDKRQGLNLHDWGLIYIRNHAQLKYLDIISEDLTKKNPEMIESLVKINETQRGTVRGLLSKLKDVLNTKHQYIDELRKDMIGTFGNFPWMIDYSQTRETFGIGKLPKTSKYPMNSIEGQAHLDFYRELDSVLIPEYNKSNLYEQTSGIGFFMDAKYMHLSGEWIICPELNELEKTDPVCRMLSRKYKI